MALTRDFKNTIQERLAADPDFATGLLDEATNLFLQGEPETARLILRDLVNATIGFEKLAVQLGVPAKSLHRMLSVAGNPSMNNLAAILGGLQKNLKVSLHAQTKLEDISHRRAQAKKRRLPRQA